jgi:hypothetical protein
MSIWHTVWLALVVGVPSFIGAFSAALWRDRRSLTWVTSRHPRDVEQDRR